MRDTVKAFMGCTWALSVFGAQQAISLAVQPGSKQLQRAREALDRITAAATADFTETSMMAYKTGASLQNAAADVLLAPLETVAAPLLPAPTPQFEVRMASAPVSGASTRARNQGPVPVPECPGWGLQK
jgi:hypothetical protein